MDVDEAAAAREEAMRLESVKSDGDRNRLRVKRKTLEVVLEQCQRALELLNETGFIDEEEEDDDGNCKDEVGDSCSASPRGDVETDELCDLLKSRVECPDFLEKLETAQASISQNMAGSSWDVVNEKDLWEGGNSELDKEDFVLVRREDIVDGMACFMAAYLMSIKQTKDLSPTQLQEALGKTFSVKKKKGKLQKAWDGSRVVYNVASWGATAVGLVLFVSLRNVKIWDVVSPIYTSNEELTCCRNRRKTLRRVCS